MTPSGRQLTMECSPFMAQPVFYDARQARWKRLRRIFDILGVGITLLVLFFAYSVLRSEQLPGLSLPQKKHLYRPFHEKEKHHLAGRRGLHRKSRLPGSQVNLNNEEGIRAAFYVNWDAASFSSLHEYARQIDLLFPEWLQVLTPDGHLQSVTPENRAFDVIQNGAVQAVDDRVMPFLKSSGAEMEVFPMVNNYDPVRENFIHDIGGFLNSPEARARFRREIALFLATDKYRGLMVDFESFPNSAQPGYRALLSELGSDLHAKGLKLYVSVQVRDEDFDYVNIAARVDGVVVMNYDEHYPGGLPGPVASQDWFTKNLVAAAKTIPRDKLICAIGAYGYDWVHKPKHGAPAGVEDARGPPEGRSRSRRRGQHQGGAGGSLGRGQ